MYELFFFGDDTLASGEWKLKTGVGQDYIPMGCRWRPRRRHGADLVEGFPCRPQTLTDALIFMYILLYICTYVYRSLMFGKIYKYVCVREERNKDP